MAPACPNPKRLFSFPPWGHSYVPVRMMYVVEHKSQLYPAAKLPLPLPDLGGTTVCPLRLRLATLQLLAHPRSNDIFFYCFPFQLQPALSCRVWSRPTYLILQLSLRGRPPQRACVDSVAGRRARSRKEPKAKKFFSDANVAQLQRPLVGHEPQPPTALPKLFAFVVELHTLFLPSERHRLLLLQQNTCSLHKSRDQNRTRTENCAA
ncbi:hypothetical protein QBC36DRAFT_33972 [Triangularia setosa]|uniref:Uncharacterized protein n=1 Tax=Triangularia setosa TaxID=2587417 RepID=A0AAN6WEN0_9PEZI|nr:hypothetical protein QBC36DRAFT_33972 [Podospora setosa]